jgi:hypothetical protein
MKHFRLLLGGLLLALLPCGVQAQVVVAPPAVVLTERDPFGTYLVINQSPEPQEVRIDFRFGYPVADSMGGISMAYGDSLPLAEWSLAPHVRAFPRQFVLQPGAQQVVRITGRPGADLPDGTYWARIVTAATPRLAAPDPALAGVRAQVVFELEQITSLMYRKGQTNTAVTVEALRIVMDDAHVGVLAQLAPGGNSPFLGEARVLVRDAAGTVRAEERDVFALYVPMTRLLLFDRTRLPAGEYTAELVVTSDRTDLTREQLLRIDPVRQDFRFRIDR